jgi:hypothetical protein
MAEICREASLGLRRDDKGAPPGWARERPSLLAEPRYAETRTRSSEDRTVSVSVIGERLKPLTMR